MIGQIQETKDPYDEWNYYLVKDSVESIKDQVAGFFQRCISIKKRSRFGREKQVDPTTLLGIILGFALIVNGISFAKIGNFIDIPVWSL